jgi:hypothetical protein
MAEVFLCWFCGKRLGTGTSLENWVVVTKESGTVPERRAHVECAEKAYQKGQYALGPKVDET